MRRHLLGIWLIAIVLSAACGPAAPAQESAGIESQPAGTSPPAIETAPSAPLPVAQPPVAEQLAERVGEEQDTPIPALPTEVGSTGLSLQDQVPTSPLRQEENQEPEATPSLPAAELSTPEQQEDSEGTPQESDTESNDTDLTPTPDVGCAEGPDGIKCFTFPVIPTPKYPELWDITIPAQEAERMLEEAEESGESVNLDDIPKQFVRVGLDSNTREVLDWLYQQGVPISSSINQPWQEGIRCEVVAVYQYGIDLEISDFIYAVIPGNLIVPLSKQEGVRSVSDGHRSWNVYGPRAVPFDCEL